MATVDDVQKHFDELFIKQIGDKLLDGSAGYLSFIAMFAGIEGLACFYGGIERDVNGGIDWKSTAHFRKFVEDFFPSPYQSLDFWGLRNSLVHRFIPAQGFHLTVNDPGIHFKRDKGMIYLDAGCVFGDFKKAATDYFEKVRNDATVGKNFEDVCREVGIINPRHSVRGSSTTSTTGDQWTGSIGP